MIKILAVGNSFSEDATHYLYKIAESADVKMIVGNLYIGGCSLERHVGNAETGAAEYDYQKNENGEWTHRENTEIAYGISDEDWDIVTIHQVSGLSGESDTYNSDIDYLCEYIHKHVSNPDVKIGWQMTWAYQQNSGHSEFARYGCDQMRMYESIAAAVCEKILPNPELDFIIPAGTAIQNMRTSFAGDNLTRDGFHLSYNLGRYIAGLVWFCSITGTPPERVSYVPDSDEIPENYIPAIREAVKNALKTPLAVTESSYKKRKA